MDPFSTLADASAGFRGFIAEIADDQWDLPACGDWSVRQLVRHVIGGDAMAIALLEGASSESALEILSGTELGDNAAAQFTSVANEMLDAFQSEGAMERIVHHPMADMPAAQVLGFRMGEAVLHGWDLARAIGADDSLSPAAVEAVWDAMEPSSEILGSLGIFGDGPSGTVADDAPIQHRLLDLAGRRP